MTGKRLLPYYNAVLSRFCLSFVSSTRIASSARLSLTNKTTQCRVCFRTMDQIIKSCYFDKAKPHLMRSSLVITTPINPTFKICKLLLQLPSMDHQSWNHDTYLSNSLLHQFRESYFMKRKQNVADVQRWPTVRLSSGERELTRRLDSHNSTNLSPECLFVEARFGMEI